MLNLLGKKLVVRSNLGAAMFAAVVADIYPDIPAAQNAMASPVERIHHPDPERAKAYDSLYARYRSLGAFEQARNRTERESSRQKTFRRFPEAGRPAIEPCGLQGLPLLRAWDGFT
jgi:ribulose kinase